jgi:hypothetical protein
MTEPVRPEPPVATRPRRMPEERPPGAVAIIAPWFAFLGGAAAWALHLMVGYVLTEIACRSERLDVVLLGLPGLDVFGFAVTLVAAATAVGAAFVAFATFPNGARADPVDDTGDHETFGRRRFMAFAGLVMNGLFMIAILAAGLPFMFLRTCGAA